MAQTPTYLIDLLLKSATFLTNSPRQIRQHAITCDRPELPERARNHTKFATEAAMALLPRFEEMDRAAREHGEDESRLDAVLVNTVAVIMSEDDAEEHADADVEIEFYPPTVSLQTVLKTADNRNRMGWNAASFLDLFEIYKSVLFSLQLLDPEAFPTPVERERMTAEALIEALQTSH